MANETVRTINKEVAKVKAQNDLGNIRDDLSTMKEHLVEDTSNLIRHSKEAGKEQIAIAEEKAKKAYETTRETSREYYSEIESYVRSNPGQSLAFAFAGGILASLLLKRN